MALAASSSCDFCRNLAPEVEKGRLVKFESVDIVAHSKCLQFSANIYQDENSTWDPELVSKELKRAQLLRCALCKEKGKKGDSLKRAGCGCAYGRYSYIRYAIRKKLWQYENLRDINLILFALCSECMNTKVPIWD